MKNSKFLENDNGFLDDYIHIGNVPLLGAVPAYYREVYEAIHCRSHEKVQLEVFQRLLHKTELSQPVIGQVKLLLQKPQ